MTYIQRNVSKEIRDSIKNNNFSENDIKIFIKLLKKGYEEQTAFEIVDTEEFYLCKGKIVVEE